MYTGFDIILVAGEANAVGVGSTVAGGGATDDTSGLPVYALDAGRLDTPLQFTQPWVVSMNEAFAHSPTTYNEGGANSIASGFAKKYISDGFLRSGRAILVVNAAKVGSSLGFNDGTTTALPAPPGARVQNTWAASTACDPAFASVSFATDFGSTGLTMNLLTHAAYRVDLALSLNPANRLNATSTIQPFSFYNTPNKLVAVLWNQGESDIAHGTSADTWGLCLADVIATLRARYGDGRYPFGDYHGVLPFFSGGYPTSITSALAADYNKYNYFNFGGGRYEQTQYCNPGLPFQDFSTTPNFINLTTKFKMLGYADSSYTFDGTNAPLGGSGSTFSQADTQLMGLRYGQAYRGMYGNPKKFASTPKPPLMGFRGYQYFQDGITQQITEASAAKLVNRSTGLPGLPTGTSLCDLGYCDVGLDSGTYVECLGTTANNPFKTHSRAGNLFFNASYFPDLKGMVNYIHSLGLTAGWYLSGCRCGESDPGANFIVQEMALFQFIGFDNLKIDSCNTYQKGNAEWFFKFMQPDTSLENCNHGSAPYVNSNADILGDQAYNQVLDPNGEPYFPYSLYRSGSDMQPVFGSLTGHDGIIPNLVSQNLVTSRNFSFPGTWAYADMLMLTGAGKPNTLPVYPNANFSQGMARTQFGAWCITSSPLILGMNIIEDYLFAQYVPIVANTEAIAIDQAYYGFPGAFFTPLLSTTTNILWLQKPMAWDGSSVAVVAINLDGSLTSSVTLVFSDIPGFNAAPANAVRDVWAHQSMAQVTTGSYSFVLAPEDCAFLKIN